MSLRIIELTYLNSYNTLNNSSYPRYGSMIISISGAGTQYAYVQSVGGSGGSTGIVTFTGLNPNTTYSAVADIVYYNENYPTNPDSWGAASLTLSVSTGGSGIPRPLMFSWSSPKISGGDMNLMAFEWNSLCSNINSVRAYKGLSSYGFTNAFSGSNFTASHYNSAVYAIRGIPGYSSVLSTVYTGDTVYAYLLNNIVSVLNSIT